MTAASSTRAGRAALRKPAAAGAGANPPLRCTYRGCPAAPIDRLEQSIGGRGWLACLEHKPAMLDALHVGMSGATSGGSFVRVTPV